MIVMITIDGALIPFVDVISESSENEAIIEHGGIATVSNESRWIQFLGINIDGVAGGKFGVGIQAFILINQPVVFFSVFLLFKTRII